MLIWRWSVKHMQNYKFIVANNVVQSIFSGVYIFKHMEDFEVQ